jgi:ubiquinone/menaquinone biosynthesis C-methylase UbiE
MEQKPLYDRLGVNYDVTRRADPYIADRLAHHLITQAPGQYLDIACGTGNYTEALAKAGINLHGLDRSPLMIAAASKKRAAVQWYVGDVESLPFKADSLTGAVCTLAVHHFREILAAFKEVFRVIGSGRFVIFTSTSEQMKGYWLAEYFPEALARSRTQMPTREYLLDSLSAAGFSSSRTEIYEVADDLQDLFLYSGKHRPDLYLSPIVRSGISTFANLIDRDELETGCRRLASDLEHGRIDEVIASYSHDRGDYLFITSEKWGF